MMKIFSTEELEDILADCNSTQLERELALFACELRRHVNEELKKANKAYNDLVEEITNA